jgi:single-strand DNA-binding protein
MSNTVTLIGNTTREPELRFTPGGQAVTTFGLAVNRRWQNRQTQQWEESTSFFDVVCWGSLAENLSESVTKGTRVIVTGRLDQRSWETQDGEKRSKIEVVADEVGPSLRWAIAQVTKSDRRNGQSGPPPGGPSPQGGYGSASGYDTPPGDYATAPAGGPRQHSAAYSDAAPGGGYAPAAGYGADEEPF